MKIKIILFCTAFLIYGICASNEQTKKSNELLVNEEKLNALLDACDKGSLSEIKSLVEDGIVNKAHEKTGLTPLIQSCLSNQFDAAKYLIDNGADVNKPHAIYGSVPLHYSSMNNNVKLVDYLLQQGAESTFTQPERWSPLFLAAQEGHVNVVKRLLENEKVRATINEKDKRGLTSLTISAKNGKVETMNILMTFGADAMLEQREKATPLFFASQEGHLKAVETLLENSQGRLSIDQANIDGVTPLLISAQKGYLQIVKALVEAGANLVRSDSLMQTPLSIASFANQWDVVKYLQEQQTAKIGGLFCAKCGKLAVNRCSGCQKVYYCSKDHQMQDWKIHKNNCLKKTTKN
jgi:ankyrin repeat protein